MKLKKAFALFFCAFSLGVTVSFVSCGSNDDKKDTDTKQEQTDNDGYTKNY